MAHRRGLLFLLPLLAAAGFAILIAIITVVLNIFLGIFADDVAGWITEMPRMNQYQYVKPEVFLCADDNPTYCKEVCDLKGNGWMFWIDGDRFLCQSPRDLSLDKSLSYYNNRVVTGQTEQDENLFVAFIGDTLGSVYANAFVSPFVYPTRAAPDPLQETIAEVFSPRTDAPSRLPFYYMMAGIGYVILTINVLIAVIYWIFEDTPLVQQKQSMTMIKKSLEVGVFIMIIPIVWDPLAIFVENAALFIMSPNGMYAGDVAAQVVLRAGAVQFPEVNLDKIASDIINSPLGPTNAIGETIGKSSQSFFVEIILSLARAQATVMTLISMFIVSIVRIEVTMIAVMMYPIAAALGITPIFNNNKLTGEVNAHIIGGLTAPIVGAIIFTVGYSSLLAGKATDDWALDVWITSLTLLIMASVIPTSTMTWVAKAEERAFSIIGDSVKTSMTMGTMMAAGLGSMMAAGGAGAGGVAATAGGKSAGFMGKLGGVGNLFGGGGGGGMGGFMGGGGMGGGGGTISATDALMGNRGGSQQISKHGGDTEQQVKQQSPLDSLKQGMKAAIPIVMPGFEKHGNVSNMVTPVTEGIQGIYTEMDEGYAAKKTELNDAVKQVRLEASEIAEESQKTAAEIKTAKTRSESVYYAAYN